MIKLLIDSASDIEQTEADELGVELVPMQIRFGKEEFLDGVNLSHGKFFEKLIEAAADKPDKRIPLRGGV